jgi:protein ImuB
MRRIASIWLPALSIERWAKSSASEPDDPVVLTVEGTHGPIIHAVTKAAAERGARPDARLTDARALDPALVAVPADLEGDAALLERLAKWAQRWSPLVEVDGTDAPSTALGTGLRLDVSGVAHLFGGEAALAQDVIDRFASIGLTARVAIASTAAAAWALSHFGGGELATLHVSALRLDTDTVRTLERLGLKTIGALAALPRLALTRRFRGAEDVVDALDRMFGRKPEPLTAIGDDPPPRALLKLEEPATHPEAAPQALDRLIPKLVLQLEQRHLGARRLSLHGFRVDGSVASACVSTAIASREPKHLARLLSDKAAALDRQRREPDGKHPPHARRSTARACGHARGTARRPKPAGPALAGRTDWRVTARSRCASAFARRSSWRSRRAAPASTAPASAPKRPRACASR